jgi:hypothetical protein
MLIDEIYESFKNKTREGIKWKMVGDMYRRMDFLLDTFADVKTITEFGPYQGCSTSAWIKLQPNKFTTVDRGIALDVELFKQAATEAGVDFNFIIGDDLEIEIEPCELLFIDTVHTDEHTFQELTIHASKASRYLAFHDVATPRFTTIDGINRWWKDHSEWKLKYKDEDDCGFMILERQ